MPELPEVEITRENLQSWLTGRMIDRTRVLDRRVLRGQSASSFTRTLRGVPVGAIRRRGKYLLADLSQGRRVLLVHLGMSGKLVLAEGTGVLPPHTRVYLARDDGARVAFRDSRVFGRIQVHSGREIATFPGLARLGPEPLARNFRPGDLARALSGSSRAVKPLLLEQQRIAGLGNIQAAEALFRAGLHPERSASSLRQEEIHRLWKAIRASLRECIRKERGPEIPFVEERGTINPFRIYGREGEPCPACGTAVTRLVQSGRSTYYCPRCQRD